MKKHVLFFSLLVTSLLQAQNYKFGKVSEGELIQTSYALEPDAPAVILYAERITTFDYSYDKGFIINNEYFSRIKIYQTAGFEYATNVIPLHYNSETFKESVKYLKGNTYNWVNGSVEKTKLENAHVFNAKKHNYMYETTFTMPKLKEGCIVEWSYTVETPFIGQLDEFKLQSSIPIAKTYCKLSVPEYYVYNHIAKGYLNIPVLKDEKKRTVNYSYHDVANTRGGFRTVSGTDNLEFDENIYVMEMSNVPSVQEEPYCGNIDNYKAGVVFELKYVAFPNKPIENFSADWEGIAKKIYENENFGGQLTLSSYFEEDITSLLNGKVNPEEKMNAIYQFVQTKIQHNNYIGYYTDNGVKKAYKDGMGNTAEINLNLINMLRFSGLEANPVLVSTIENGIPLFPSRSGFNYVIAHVQYSGKSILLDATNPHLTPGMLPLEILNFQGREIKKDGTSAWVDLFPNEHSVTQYNVTTSLIDDRFSGTFRVNRNQYAALLYRQKYATVYENKENMIKNMSEKYTNIDVLDYRINNMKDNHKEVVENLKFESDELFENISGKIYINPLLFLNTTENDFKLEKRSYPVFFKVPYIEKYAISINLPEKYSVEHLPTAADISFKERMGNYYYKISQTDNQLIVESLLAINEPVISGEDYPDLKAFFDQIIQKQAEKIVLTEAKQ